jgi:DNA-binding transcriptional ArsR family regulator
MAGDLLGAIRRELDQRLAELAPFVMEFDRLTSARATLAADGGGPETAQGRRPRASSRRGPGSQPAKRRGNNSRSRAPRGQNRQKILAVVGERPGVSAAEVAAASGVARPTVYTTVSKLKKEGVLVVEGERGLRVSGRRTSGGH